MRMQSTLENFRLAIVALSSNWLRAFLTILGITIGVSAVVLLLSVGRAFERFVVNEFFDIGTDTIAVFGSEGERGDFEPLTQSDLEALSDPLRVPDAILTTAFLDLSGREVTYEDRSTEPSIFGLTTEYREFDNRDVAAGRYIDAEDNEGAARVAVLGSSAVENLFPPGLPPLGQTVRISGIPFRVIGVMTEGGSGGFADLDNSVFVPIRTGQTRLTTQRAVNGDPIVTQILLQARSQDAVDSLVDQITVTLREEHDIDFSGEDDFVISTAEDLLDSFGTILRYLTYFLAAIASISLIVGGIGIMNIMLVTVTERTKEIGLRKAVGAKNSDILLQFVTEAILLALIGGGVGIAIAGAAVSAIVPAFDVTLETFSVILAVGISTLIGVVFGLFPARRAANLNPIDALRYE
ncbi:MAG: ABC transporter permease [Chloroflexota bacterium]